MSSLCIYAVHRGDDSYFHFVNVKLYDDMNDDGTLPHTLEKFNEN